MPIYREFMWRGISDSINITERKEQTGKDRIKVKYIDKNIVKIKK